MRRRSYLAALSSVGAGALAGCVTSDGQSTASDTVTTTRTATATDGPDPLHCESRLTPTTPYSGGDHRQPYPEFPDELTEQTALSFARQFERARWRNDVAADYGDRLDDYTVLMQRSDVRTVEDGYLVDYSLTFGFSYTAENAVVEADHGADVTYFVGPTIARRSEVEDDPRDPEAGEIVLCRPGE